jgi:hypothetical protein
MSFELANALRNVMQIVQALVDQVQTLALTSRAFYNGTYSSSSSLSADETNGGFGRTPQQLTWKCLMSLVLPS